MSSALLTTWNKDRLSSSTERSTKPSSDPTLWKEITMKIGMPSVLFGLFSLVVTKPAPNPQITPAPLIKRDEAFVGFYSSVSGTDTVCKLPNFLPISINLAVGAASNCPDDLTLTTSGNFWACCGNSDCILNTGCLGTSIQVSETAIDWYVTADNTEAQVLTI
jgi:hypothetical protein